MFTSWCEWVLRQAKSGPMQVKGKRAACPKDKLEFKFFSEPCKICTWQPNFEIFFT